MGRFFFAVALAALAACTDFPTEFSRIEDDKPRLIDFIYEPPEAAPGDTVELLALFGGRSVTPDDIDWKISCRVLQNIYGVDTSFDEKALDCTEEAFRFSDNTSCIRVRFAVPRDCIRQSPMVPDDWKSVLPEAIIRQIPESIASQSRESLLELMESISDRVEKAKDSELPAIAGYIDTLMGGQFARSLALAIQLTTVKIRLFADVAGSHDIRSDYTVNYNAPLSRLPRSIASPNRNPVIDSVCIYRAKGVSLLTFDAADPDVQRIRIWPSPDIDDTVEVLIDKGYTYFISGECSGWDRPLTLTNLLQGGPLESEEYTFDWMYQMDRDQIEGVASSDLMGINTMGLPYGTLVPPCNKKVRDVIIWLQVTDSKLDVLNRSQGSCVAEAMCRFAYTDAYLGQVK